MKSYLQGKQVTTYMTVVSKKKKKYNIAITPLRDVIYKNVMLIFFLPEQRPAAVHHMAL